LTFESCRSPRPPIMALGLSSAFPTAITIRALKSESEKRMSVGCDECCGFGASDRRPSSLPRPFQFLSLLNAPIRTIRIPAVDCVKRRTKVKGCASRGLWFHAKVGAVLWVESRQV
jgi:hypothetical protein